MADTLNELHALRPQVAALTARLYRFELARDSFSGIAPRVIAPSVPQTVSIPLVATAPVPDCPRANATRPPPRLTAPPPQPNVPLNPVAASAAYTGRPDSRPWSERHPAILWTAIIAAVLIPGGIAVRSLKITANPT